MLKEKDIVVGKHYKVIENTNSIFGSGYNLMYLKNNKVRVLGMKDGFLLIEDDLQEKHICEPKNLDLWEEEDYTSPIPPETRKINYDKFHLIFHTAIKVIFTTFMAIWIFNFIRMFIGITPSKLIMGISMVITIYFFIQFLYASFIATKD